MSELHVIFGTGPVGRWTARELVKMGKQVRMINRSGRADGLPGQVEVVSGDAFDAGRNIQLTRDAEAIYQCAQPLYHEWAGKFPALQAAILEAAAANKARLIVCDNLYMYGDTHGQPIHEDMPYQPHTKKGRIRAEMANAVMEAHRAGRIRAAVGRASDFFGPEDHAVTDYGIRPAVTGRTIHLLGRLDQPHTFTYVPDFGRLLATLGTREEALGQIWFTPSPAPVSQSEFVGMLEQELGRPVKVMAAGTTVMRALGLFDPTLRETVEMMYEWTQPFIMDSSKAERSFGWSAVPWQNAIQETITWLVQDIKRQNPALMEKTNGKDIQRTLHRQDR